VTAPAVPTTTAALLVNDHQNYLLHLRDANKPIWDSVGVLRATSAS
jgi:isochorismate hydrolase